MAPLVVLALAAAVAAAGAAAVATLMVLRSTRQLRAGVDRARSRLQPLLDELTAEAAVSATETEALQARLVDFGRQRAASRGRGRRGVRRGTAWYDGRTAASHA